MRAILAVTLLLVAAACAPGRDLRPVVRHGLDGEPMASAIAPAGPVLKVVTPRGLPPYDGEAMVYVPEPGVVAFYAYHRWADTPARLLAPLLIEALAASGAFRAVLPPTSLAGADLRLESEIRSFEQVLEGAGASHVRIVIDARLIDSASGRVRASRRFAALRPASPDAKGASAGMRAALRELLPALAAWAAKAAREG